MSGGSGGRRRAAQLREDLEAENAKLREEIARLKEELEKLRTKSAHPGS